eukprot:scaffold20807_cov59-Cylindrotheca_fusiformis.AAC.1
MQVQTYIVWSKYVQRQYCVVPWLVEEPFEANFGYNRDSVRAGAADRCCCSSGEGWSLELPNVERRANFEDLPNLAEG